MRNNQLEYSIFLIVTLLFTSCGVSSNRKIIKAMAKYLESTSTTLYSSTSSCLSSDIIPPELPSHLQYAGYFFSNPSSPVAKTKTAFSNGIDEIVAQGNAVTIAYLPQEILDPSTNPDELLISKITTARDRGFKVVIEIPILFFDYNYTKMRFEVKSLSPNYRSNWNHFKDLITPYLDTIIGFYPYDEPYWAASNQGVAASDMKQFLDEIGLTIKADLPQIPLIFIEAYPMVKADLQIPAGWDWVGMDCYGSFESCGKPGSQLSIPEYYNILKSKMTPAQKLVVIPDAFLFTETPSKEAELELVKRAKKFLDWIGSEPRVVAVVPFVYRNLAEEHITGAREMCPVREFYKTYLTNARSKLLTPPKVSISCPTHLIAESSGTCLADLQGSITSGYWLVNDEKIINSDNQKSYTWNNIAAGRYKIQGVAKDNYGKTLYSNIVTVTVLPKTPEIKVSLSITCPQMLEAGSSGTCTSNYTGNIVSGYWTVDGVKTTNSDNLKNFTWSNIPVGNYKIQGIVVDKLGNKIVSNIVQVTVVNKTSVIISCPTLLIEGASGTCTSKITGAAKSGYWLVNGNKQIGSDNLPTFTWKSIPAGLYNVQGIITDQNNNIYFSNVINVIVKKK